MTSSIRRLFAALLALSLIAAACSSGSDEDTAAFTDTGGQIDEAADAGQEDEVPTTTSIPVPEDDSAADAAIAGLDDEEPAEVVDLEPAEVARDFVRSRFNIDPEPEWVDCIVDQASSDDVLDLALQTQAVAGGQVDDSQLKAMSFAMNGCIEPVSLGDWTTQAVGPQGDIRDTAPACFAERYSEADRGDVTFYTIVALTYQFRVEPDGVPDALDAFVNCTPVTALSEFFANQAESTAGFSIVIDRDCLNQELADPAVSELFWSTLIEGLQPPINAMAPYLDSCEADANAGLDDSVPSDFVAWSGSGALASVAPAARANVYSSPPPMTIDPSANYEAVFATAGGEIRIELLADSAPITVNNFVNLARDGYFDGTVFHRVLADFMAQGGDPTGTGTGGPGYQFEDEVDGGPPLDRPGLLAMANAGPGTNGSQFFITFVPTDWLTGNHTVFGEVVDGMDIVNAIELRDPGAPSGRGQVLESVTIIES